MIHESSWISLDINLQQFDTQMLTAVVQSHWALLCRYGWTSVEGMMKPSGMIVQRLCRWYKGTRESWTSKSWGIWWDMQRAGLIEAAPSTTRCQACAKWCQCELQMSDSKGYFPHCKSSLTKVTDSKERLNHGLTNRNGLINTSKSTTLYYKYIAFEELADHQIVLTQLCSKTQPHRILIRKCRSIRRESKMLQIRETVHLWWAIEDNTP